MNAVRVGDTTVSSTRIREALLAGEVRLAASLLGRPYNLGGRVISGNRRGVRLGFPTANISPDKELVPARGVYAVQVLLEGIRRQGVLSIGINPTFTDGKRSIEVHILDFHEDIYDKTLDMLFIERLRDEIRFDKPRGADRPDRPGHRPGPGDPSGGAMRGRFAAKRGDRTPVSRPIQDTRQRWRRSGERQ